MPGFSRREALAAAAAGGFASLGGPFGLPQALAQTVPAQAGGRQYAFKKSINLWAFPYPQQMSLEKCLRLAKDAGFNGIELNYDLDSDLSPKSGTREFEQIRKLADKIGIAISGLCSFLFWPYPLTANDPARRERGLELAGKMAQAAHDLGTENLLVVPGAVHIPWRTDHVHVHFDTGNIMEYQFPEHWIPILGQRIRNVHLKEYTKKGTDHSLEAFRPLLDGTTNWPAVLEAFDATGYRGYLTFEYFHPYQHWPEALIYQTSDSLDRMLGRKLA